MSLLYLTLDVVLAEHERRIGPNLVRDPGLVGSTLERPQG